MIGNGGVSGVTKGAGYFVVNKFGVNFDIDTTSIPETIWAHGGIFPFLDTGIEMDIVSTSANDNLSGTGAQKITIIYYTADNTEVTVEKDLNGLTAVLLADDVKIITRAFISQSGSSNTNEGEINIVDRATGLIVYQSIEISEGQTLSAVQICPKGKKGLVKHHSVSYAKDQSPLGSADLRLNLRLADGSVLTKHSIAISSIKPQDDVRYDKGGIEMQEGEILFWECIAVSANDTPIEARFDIEFQDI
jgi:hypothetical protein